MTEHPESANAFDFVNGVPANGASPNTFVLRVNSGIQTKAELLRVLANVGRFPDYFGQNWDALLECLLDFGWVREKQIVIAHSDVPLLQQQNDCRVYLDILREARLGWLSAKEHSDLSIGEAWVAHELRVCFPSDDRSSVMHMLDCDRS